MSGKDLGLRADAGGLVGTGHFTRCLALARLWKRDSGRATILTSMTDPFLRSKAKTAGVTMAAIDQTYPDPRDLDTVGRWVEQHDNPWCLVDGYHFDDTYEEAIKGFGGLLISMDDYGHSEHRHSDIIINQSISAPEIEYQAKAGCRMLLGCKFALLAPEFQIWRERKREIPPVARTILVTLGGSESAGRSDRILKAVSGVMDSDMQLILVIGGADEDVQQIRSQARRFPANIRIIQNAQNMPDLMAEADVAISGGGSTIWELACLGVPNIITILASNQYRNAADAEKAGFAINTGWLTELDDSSLAQTVKELLRDRRRRMVMSEVGRELVDGRGCERVVAELLG